MSFVFNRQEFLGNGSIAPYHIVLSDDPSETQKLVEALCSVNLFDIVRYTGGSIGAGGFLLDTIIIADKLDYGLIENMMRQSNSGSRRILIIRATFDSSVELYNQSTYNVAYKAFLHLGASSLSEHMPTIDHYKVYHDDYFINNHIGMEHTQCSRGAIVEILLNS